MPPENRSHRVRQRQRTRTLRSRAVLLPLLTLCLYTLSVPPTVQASPLAQANALSPEEVIEAVNALRIANGLPPLSVHHVLMEVAQWEADAIAGGAPGHTRPNGLTLGQWLISLGYPLAGDLTLDGYRSENWVAAASAQEAVEIWLGDAPHTNTMLSPDRSDIGAGVAVGDQTYVVIETALQTGSGQMQSGAGDILTAVAGGALSEGADPLISQYILPLRLSTAHPNGDVYHSVGSGQALWSIANGYHTTVDQLRAWNNMGEDSMIYTGQVLLVARGATRPPPATPTPQATPTVYTVTPGSTPHSAATPTATTGSELAAEAAPGGHALGSWAWVIFLLAVAGSALGTWLTSRPRLEKDP